MINKKKKNNLQFLKKNIKKTNIKTNKSAINNNNILYKNTIYTLKTKKYCKGLSQLEWKKNKKMSKLHLSRWEVCKLISEDSLSLIFKR